MNCTKVKQLLSDYYDSELPLDHRRNVAMHLDDCAECSLELARFGKLSGMVQCLPASVPSELGWKPLQDQLGTQPTVDATERVMRSEQSRARLFSFRALHLALAVAALLVVAIGWFTFDTWFAPGSHNILAGDIEQYVKGFQHDPDTAQQLLVAKFHGQRIGLDEAVQRVSYRPAVASGLPKAYTVDSMYLLKMPCCDCLQTVCQRSDGSRFVIVEYGEEQPLSARVRPGGMAQCRGENCCLAEINKQFAASWKADKRHISLVGVRDQAEVEGLVAWLK